MQIGGSYVFPAFSDRLLSRVDLKGSDSLRLFSGFSWQNMAVLEYMNHQRIPEQITQSTHVPWRCHPSMNPQMLCWLGTDEHHWPDNAYRCLSFSLVRPWRSLKPVITQSCALRRLLQAIIDLMAYDWGYPKNCLTGRRTLGCPRRDLCIRTLIVHLI